MLAEIGADARAARSALTQALLDIKAHVRRQSLRALHRMGVCSLEVEACLHDPDREVRAEACAFVRTSGRTKAVPLLLTWLDDKPLPAEAYNFKAAFGADTMAFS